MNGHLGVVQILLDYKANANILAKVSNVVEHISYIRMPMGMSNENL